jgi:hypothetical protein
MFGPIRFSAWRKSLPFGPVLFLAAWVMAAALPALGQTQPLRTIYTPSTDPVEVKADSIEYDTVKRLMVLSGRVVLRRGPEILRANYALYNRESGDAWAEGDVRFERGSEAWSGAKLHYNFRTGEGDFGTFSSFLYPFYVKAQSSRRVSEEEYLLHNAVLTTCEGPNPKSHFTAATVRLVPGRRIHARHVFVYVGDVPVFYTPVWSQNLGDPNFISVVPGFNSRFSAFLLTAFNYRLTRNLEASTRVDVRLRRGLGVGQDLLWSAGGNSRGPSTEAFKDNTDDPIFLGQGTPILREAPEVYDEWFGDFLAYYAHDNWPDEGDSTVTGIGSDRYRLRLYHSQSFDERNYLLVLGNYMSDSPFIRHFFRDEWKSNPEPDNYLVYMNRGEHYTASLTLQRHLNDFYTTIDRFPELALDLSRQQIADTPFYYKGKTFGGYLEKSWADTETNQANYAIFRADTDHTVYYQHKLFGFLNLIPRAGWRGTYFSKTKQDTNEIVTTTVTDTNGVVTIESTTNAVVQELGGKFRSVYELGVETSFKAFKVWETYPGEVVNDLRHIVEPYADYTYRPEPNVLATNLYQFDAVDQLARANGIKVGLRNKLQTRRDNVYSLIDLDVWTLYRLAPETGENQFDDLYWLLKSAPSDRIGLRLDGQYDPYEGTLKQINTRLTFTHPQWAWEAEHRHADGGSDMLYGRFAVSPGGNWGFRVFARYEFEGNGFDNYGAAIQRTMDCVATMVGYEWEDDEYAVWLQFWFTAFPRVRVDVGM